MTMHVIETTASAGLRLAERPLPEPPAGAVRLRVRAAGVNRPDLLQRRGLYPPPEGASDVLGLEVAGEVDALGEGVTGWTLGDPVMALLPGGGYATHALCDARHLLRKPDSLSFEAAAGFPETAYTVWANVFEAGRLRAGERLFVHGATSGIGTTACAMARALGGTTGTEVWGTAGTREGCEAALSHGYARCWPREAAWDAEAHAAGGADVVLDMAGGDYVARNLSFLRAGGRHVSIAFLRGVACEVNVMDVMRRRLTLTGSTLRARPGEEKARLTDEIRRHVLPHLGRGALSPVIDRVFPLAEAEAAHDHLEAGGHVGKVILRVDRAA